jgi:5-methylcytosine-specific restriction endonuclease McrA
MNYVDEFNAQWRASAHEAVQYSDDMPECFLVLPELIDGAISQGAASKIIISININNDVGILKVTDNGKGISNIDRLLNWASKDSTTVHHRYGHGSKKCLTKWNKDYYSKWYIKHRTCDKKGKSGSLFTYNGPFRGIKMQADEDENDDTSLMPSGLEWCIEFNNKEIMGNNCSPEKIFEIIKETLRTRYSKKFFDVTEFIIQVNDIKESSKDKKWKTFQECLEDEVKLNNCKIIKNISEDFNDIKMTYVKYNIFIDGHKDFNLKKEFPIYGRKNMLCSRLHIALSGRTIEIAPFWKFIKGRESNHNSLNGIFGFINFEGDYTKMPTPCTTKVSFYENCDNFKKFMDLIYKLNEIEEVMEPKIEESIKSKVVESIKPKVVESIKPKVVEIIKPKSKKTKEEKSDSEELEDKPIPKKVKDDVWNHYIGENIATHKCLCCKKKTIKNTEFVCGHVIPRCKKGKITVDNLRPICFGCNSSMGKKNMIDFVTEHEYYIG